MKNGSLSGLPADLTMEGLHRSEYKFAEAKKLPTLGGAVAAVICCLVMPYMADSGIALGYQTSSQGVNLGMINLKPAIEAIEEKARLAREADEAARLKAEEDKAKLADS